jgi:hypothetical protein
LGDDNRLRHPAIFLGFLICKLVGIHCGMLRFGFTLDLMM